MNTIKQKFSYDTKEVILILLSLGVIALFWFLPAPAPLTAVGMKVVGIFIGIVMLLSLVDTIWPVFLGYILIYMSGIMTFNEVLVNSVGHWVFSFVVGSLILTNALNKSGFTSRLTNYLLSRKISQSGPWAFTIVYLGICYLVGAFMDQVPATAFFLAFTGEILKKLGYDKNEKYANTLVMGAIFAVNLGGAATPISHPLVILGLGIYESTIGQPINLLTYMIYAVPATLLMLLMLILILKFIIRPDTSKFAQIDLTKITEKQKEMELREKTIVIIFFFIVAMWILPGILQAILPAGNVLVTFLFKYSITFWAFVGLILLSVIKVNKEPLLDLHEQMNSKLPWSTIFFISIGMLLGSAIALEEVGLNEFIVENLSPILAAAPTMGIVFIFAFASILLTNFTSNTSVVVLMTGVAITVGQASPELNTVALAITTTMSGCLAFMLPSSFAPIAMLHADENSNFNMVLGYGTLLLPICAVIATYVGYPLLTAIM